MFPGNIEQVLLERRKDLLREVERLRLINSLPRRPSVGRRAARKAVNWIAVHMVVWGLKLQRSQTEPSSQTAVAAASDHGCK